MCSSALELWLSIHNTTPRTTVWFSTSTTHTHTQIRAHIHTRASLAHIPFENGVQNGCGWAQKSSEKNWTWTNFYEQKPNNEPKCFGLQLQFLCSMIWGMPRHIKMIAFYIYIFTPIFFLSLDFLFVCIQNSEHLLNRNTFTDIMSFIFSAFFLSLLFICTSQF